MKYARKRDRLAARRKSFDNQKRTDGCKRPGSFKERGDGGVKKKGRSNVQNRSRDAVNSR